MTPVRVKLAKAITWRIGGTAVLFAVSYLVTGSASVGGTIALVHGLLQVAMFIVHEWVWERILYSDRPRYRPSRTRDEARIDR